VVKIKLALDREEVEDLQTSSTASDALKWTPYPSKVVFLLDIIDNLPRLRISGSFMKVLLWLLGELGVKQVPSFVTLRKIQKSLREDCGVPTIQWMSPKGNVFSFNDPRVLVSNVSACIFLSLERLGMRAYRVPKGLDKPIDLPAHSPISCDT